MITQNCKKSNKKKFSIVFQPSPFDRNIGCYSLSRYIADIVIKLVIALTDPEAYRVSKSRQFCIQLTQLNEESGNA